MTQAGEEWLIAATDPYHDKALEISGYPDYQSINTVVEVVKRKMTVTAPPNLASTALWDCHVMTLPIAESHYMAPCYIPAGSVYVTPSAPNSSTPIFGTVTAVSVPTGSVTTPTQGAFPNFGAGATAPTCSATSVSIVNIDMASGSPTYGQAIDSFLDGKARVIALGFEVTNTTAALYRGGSCSCYSIDNNPTEVVMAGPGIVSARADVTRVAPATDQEEFLSPDAVQWGAEEGCYVVARQSGPSNPFSSPVWRVPIQFAKDTVPGYNPINNGWLFFNGQPLNAPPNLAADYSSPAMAPFMGSGAFFSGLNANTSLTITMRAIVERAASTDQSDMLVVSRPSPAYDPACFEAASRIWRKMPPGTQKGNNFLGKWFSDAVSTLGRVAKPVAATIVRELLPAPVPEARVQRVKIKKATTKPKLKKFKKTRS